MPRRGTRPAPNIRSTIVWRGTRARDDLPFVPRPLAKRRAIPHSRDTRRRLTNPLEQSTFHLPRLNLDRRIPSGAPSIKMSFVRNWTVPAQLLRYVVWPRYCSRVISLPCATNFERCSRDLNFSSKKSPTATTCARASSAATSISSSSTCKLAPWEAWRFVWTFATKNPTEPLSPSPF